MKFVKHLCAVVVITLALTQHSVADGPSWTGYGKPDKSNCLSKEAFTSKLEQELQKVAVIVGVAEVEKRVNQFLGANRQPAGGSRCHSGNFPFQIVRNLFHDVSEYFSSDSAFSNDDFEDTYERVDNFRTVITNCWKCASEALDSQIEEFDEEIILFSDPDDSF